MNVWLLDPCVEFNACGRCGHRHDQHAEIDGVFACIVCDRLALDKPCSTISLGGMIQIDDAPDPDAMSRRHWLELNRPA
jgi:hypothetical protein